MMPKQAMMMDEREMPSDMPDEKEPKPMLRKIGKKKGSAGKMPEAFLRKIGKRRTL